MTKLKKSEEDVKELKNEKKMISKQVLNLQKMNLKRKWKGQGKNLESICEVYDTQIGPELVNNKLIDLEDRSRRNSLRIYEGTETNDVKSMLSKRLLKSQV